jgi:hypothetical protein
MIVSRQKLLEGNDALYNYLNELRIVKKNLVYIIGLSPELADETVFVYPDIERHCLSRTVWKYRKMRSQ